MYQRPAASVAAARQNPEASRPTFAEEIQSIARRLIFSTPRASTSDRQFLQDVARDECRYPLKALERLSRIAQQSTRVEHRDALASLIIARTTPSDESTDLIAVSHLETIAESEANIAVHTFEHARTKAGWMVAREKVRAHLARLTVLAQAIERTAVQ